jgi:hypothetical protein
MFATVGKDPWKHGRNMTRLREKAQLGRGARNAATTSTKLKNTNTLKLFSTSLIKDYM